MHSPLRAHARDLTALTLRATAWAALLLTVAGVSPARAQLGDAAPTSAAFEDFATVLWGCTLETPARVDVGGGAPTAVAAAAEDRACVADAVSRLLRTTSFARRTRLTVTRTSAGIVDVSRETPAPTDRARLDPAAALVPVEASVLRDHDQGRALLLGAPALLLLSGILAAAGALEMNPIRFDFCWSDCPPRTAPNLDAVIGSGVASGVFFMGAVALFAGGVDLSSRRSGVRLAGGPGELGLGLAASF